MSMHRALVQAIASIPPISVSGLYHRVLAERNLDRALDGSRHGGRWGPADIFPVLYLTDHLDALIIEAYRHYGDPTEATPSPKPRRMVTISCKVNVTRIFDLGTATARMQLGLTEAILYAEPDSQESYRSCSHIAQAAHQLGLHGILAPSSTGAAGAYTLVLFTDLLPEAEQPVRVGGVQRWSDELPADPRVLRIVTRSSEDGE